MDSTYMHAYMHALKTFSNVLKCTGATWTYTATEMDFWIDILY